MPEVTAAIPRGARVHALDAFALTWTRDLDSRTFRERAGLDPDENVLASVPIMGGYGPLPVDRSRQLALRATPGLLARAGVSFLVVPRSRAFRDLLVVDHFATVNLYELPGSAPLARLAGETATAADAGQAFELASKLPAKTAVLEEPLAGPVHPGEARIAVQKDGEIAVAVSAPERALLVLAFTWFPGWTATVDGEPARVLRADYAFMGVELPAGAKRALLRYEPASFRAGLGLSALGLVALLGLGRLRLARAFPPGP